jgi:hypothetical protein
MSELFRSGRALDLALLIVLVEIATLMLLRRRRRRMPGAPDMTAHLCAAAGLLLAARLMLAHAPWMLAASALALGGIAHLLAWRVHVAPARAESMP